MCHMAHETLSTKTQFPASQVIQIEYLDLVRERIFGVRPGSVRGGPELLRQAGGIVARPMAVVRAAVCMGGEPHDRHMYSWTLVWMTYSGAINHKESREVDYH